MKHSINTRGTVFGAALLIGLTCFGSARTAHASSDYPAALTAELDKYPAFAGKKFCVPLCTACHNTTKGGPGDTNKFGLNLKAIGHLAGANVDGVGDAVKKVLDLNLDSDGDGVTDAMELLAGDSPSLAKPRGESEFCSDIKYGCGARIASAPPPVDRLGLFSAGLMVLGLAALRRRSRRDPR